MHRTPPASQRGARLALATLALTLCLPGLAQEGPALPLWELGAVGVAVSQQAYPGSLERVQQALALPFFIYRGEFLRVDRGSAGIRALKTPALELDVGVSGAWVRAPAMWLRGAAWQTWARWSSLVRDCAGISAPPPARISGVQTCRCAACLT